MQSVQQVEKMMSKARNADERELAYRNYSQHVLAQWIDRQAHWTHRALSNSWFRAWAKSIIPHLPGEGC